jgi:outer membrane lipoprotein carrier protein
MRYLRLLLPLYLLVFGSYSHGDALSELSARLEPLQTLQGNFQQETRSSAGEVLDQAKGRLKLLRPAYFSWHIDTPEEQLLVASGSTLWHYDVELETATRRTLDPGSPTNPLRILGGDTAALGQHYRVEAIDENGWRLSPLFETGEFTSVELFFEGSLPSRMSVRDALDRESIIIFSGLESNLELGPADFEFRPPPGVDVYDSEG